MASFEGKCFSPLESANKIREDWLEWIEAQKNEEEGLLPVSCRVNLRTNDQRQSMEGDKSGWSPPPPNWLKCNIGISWSNRNKLAGCAWVLRDHCGVVLLHSRRVFVRVNVKEDAQFLGLMWAIESMRSHRVVKVIFALQVEVLVKAINRPVAWPSFRYQSMEAILALKYFSAWKILLENSFSNRGAFLIAKSVTNECRLHSYVACSHPTWLEGVFAEERVETCD